MAKMKENSIKVYNYVAAHEDENITARDIAKALELEIKQVNGIVTAAFQCHKEIRNEEKVTVPLMERVEGEIETETSDGNVKKETVKFIRLTEEGKAFDVNAD